MAKAATTSARRPQAPSSASVDPADVARFNALGEEWWDLWGPMRALHKLNPTRVDYIRDILVEEICAKSQENAEKPLAGLKLLDIGCGAGILSEPLAALGAEMTSVDPAPMNIEVAKAHSEKSGLSIDYRAMTAEELAETGAQFDAVVTDSEGDSARIQLAGLPVVARVRAPGVLPGDRIAVRLDQADSANGRLAFSLTP